MSSNPNPYTDSSGFNYSAAAGIPTNTFQTHFSNIHAGDKLIPESIKSVPVTPLTQPVLEVHTQPIISENFGKLGGEHGGAGTRENDRKGEIVNHEVDDASPVTKHYQRPVK